MTNLTKSLIYGIAAVAITTALTAGSADAAFRGMRMGGAHVGGIRMGGMKMGGHGFMQHAGLRSSGSHFGKLHDARHFAKAGGKSNHAAKHDGDGGKHHGDDDKHDHDHFKDHDHEHHHDHLVVLIEPPVLVDNPGGPVIIGDDPPKDGGKTVEKKAPVCKWMLVKVTVTDYGKGDRKKWVKDLEDKAVDIAKEFVKKNGSKAAQTWLKAIVENVTINKAKDVLLTFACVDDSDNVIQTKVVLLDDADALTWWDGTKLVEGKKAEQTKVITREKNKLPQVMAKK